MNPWHNKIQNSGDAEHGQGGFGAGLEHRDARLLGIDACLRRAMHELDGECYEERMRVDLRMLALAGFIPERGYKKAAAFRDAVDLLRELGKNTK